MINFNDHIRVSSGGQVSKRYRATCDKCNKDRGYIQFVASGKRMTSQFCVSCKNGTTQKPGEKYLCSFCNTEEILPCNLGENNDHWFWDKNPNLKNKGSWRCYRYLINKNSLWASNNSDKILQKYKKGSAKYRNSAHGRLRNSISSRMSSLLSKRQIIKIELESKLPWTITELIIHLESKFKPGMTWDNYGKNGWHVDHIIPDSWFNYNSTNDEGFKNSWALSNLQPLWASENLSKSNKWVG